MICWTVKKAKQDRRKYNKQIQGTIIIRNAFFLRDSYFILLFKRFSKHLKGLCSRTMYVGTYPTVEWIIFESFFFIICTSDNSIRILNDYGMILIINNITWKYLTPNQCVISIISTYVTLRLTYNYHFTCQNLKIYNNLFWLIAQQV